MAVASRKKSLRSRHSEHMKSDIPSLPCYLAIIPTAWGNCGVAWRCANNHKDKTYQDLPCSGVLSRILIPGLNEADLRAVFPHATEVLPDRGGLFRSEIVPSWFDELVSFLQEYFSSDLRAADAPDQPAGLPIWPLWRPRLDIEQISEFQLRVLDVVAAIPRGHVMTYGQVAQKLSAPQAARAVGMALSRNPWPVLVPCHRVIASTGNLTGFTAPGGITTKKRMLQLEGYLNPLWHA